MDARLRKELEQRGWPRLSATQSLMFAHLDRAGTAPSELARRLGTTRQSTAEVVVGIARLGLVEVVADPARPRGRLVRLTGDGHKLAADALEVLTGLEAELGEIGRRLRRDLGALASGERGVGS
jgi:DNA-binding MarR family transcriptional regulator